MLICCPDKKLKKKCYVKKKTYFMFCVTDDGAEVASEATNYFEGSMPQFSSNSNSSTPILECCSNNGSSHLLSGNCMERVTIHWSVYYC